MGMFSSLLRYREAGEPVSSENLEAYGAPALSLFSSSRLVSLHKKMEITDENGNVLYRSESKFPSLHDKTDITDADGRQVAHIERKFFSLHERHYVTMYDGTCFEISNELFHLIRDITNIEGLGWQLRGNILALNFELFDENDRIIACISQKVLSLHDKYCMDIYQPRHEKTVVAILITLQHMIRDRESSAAASSGSSSSSSN